MNASTWCYAFLIAHFLCLSNSARILGVFPIAARSHFILGSTLMRELAERGHDVTIVSPYDDKTPPKNATYRAIVLPELVEKLQGKLFKENSMFDREQGIPFIGSFFFLPFMAELCEDVLKHEKMQNLIHSQEHFDVVIVEQFINDALKGLALHFNAPLILFSTIGPNYWVNSLVGNPGPPSYIPDKAFPYTNRMSFCERLINSFAYLLTDLVYNLYVFPKNNELVKKHISTDYDLYDILYNSSLVLLNSHTSIYDAVPQVPSMIEIGGFHVKPPKKLPSDLQQFLDKSKNGVIYFSMGSNLRSADLPIDKRQAILNTFAKLKQNVLWKWEEDVLPGQPQNVKLSKWWPQQDILAHPNVQLFITHGGLLSTTETIYHGVPILTIPIFGDQKMNAMNAVKNGYAVNLPYQEISEEKMTWKIHEILNNPKYRDNVKLRSKLFHDRIVSPMDMAVYWIEFIIRHRGAPNLRVAGLDLPWYKYHLLDILTFTIITSLVMLTITIKILKIVTHKLCMKTKQPSKGKVKKS